MMPRELRVRTKVSDSELSNAYLMLHDRAAFEIRKKCKIKMKYGNSDQISKNLKIIVAPSCATVALRSLANCDCLIRAKGSRGDDGPGPCIVKLLQASVEHSQHTSAS